MKVPLVPMKPMMPMKPMKPWVPMEQRALFVAVQVIPAIMILALYIGVFGASGPFSWAGVDVAMSKVVARSSDCSELAVVSPINGRLIVVKDTMHSCKHRGDEIELCYVDGSNVVDVVDVSDPSACNFAHTFAFACNAIHIFAFLFVMYESAFTCFFVVAMARDRFVQFYNRWFNPDATLDLTFDIDDVIV